MTVYRKDIVEINTTIVAVAKDNDNFANCLLLVEDNGFSATSGRLYGIYHSKELALEDFKGNQKAVEAIEVFFAQTDNPITAGGRLAIGVITASSIAIPATMVGGIIQSAKILNYVNNVSSTLILNAELNGVKITGSFSLSPPISGDLHEIIDALNKAAVTGNNPVAGSPYEGKISFAYSDGRIEAKIANQAAQQSLIFTGEGAELLGLTADSGSVLNQAITKSSGELATVEQALEYYGRIIDFHGVAATDDIPDGTYINANVNAWLKENKAILYTASSADLATVNAPTSPTKFSHIKVCYCPAGLAQKNLLGAAIMGYMHGINLKTQGSATTLHLKTLAGVDPIPLTKKQSDMLSFVDIDFYDVIKDTPVYFDSSGDGFVDNVYNLTYIEFLVQKNLSDLVQSVKKIPQTQNGVHQIYANISNTLHIFKDAGVLGLGLEWKAAFSFGLKADFKAGIKNHGYYIFIDSLDTQSLADRNKRLCPPIYIAVQFAGAIHKAVISLIAEY